MSENIKNDIQPMKIQMCIFEPGEHVFQEVIYNTPYIPLLTKYIFH